MVKCKWCNKKIDGEVITLSKECYTLLTCKYTHNLSVEMNPIVEEQFAEIIRLLHDLILRVDRLESQINLTKKLRKLNIKV